MLGSKLVHGSRFAHGPVRPSDGVKSGEDEEDQAKTPYGSQHGTDGLVPLGRILIPLFFAQIDGKDTQEDEE